MVWYEVIIDGTLWDEFDNIGEAVAEFNKNIDRIIEEEFDGDEAAFERETYDYDYRVVKKEVLLDYHHYDDFN